MSNRGYYGEYLKEFKHFKDKWQESGVSLDSKLEIKYIGFFYLPEWLYRSFSFIGIYSMCKVASVGPQ